MKCSILLSLFLVVSVLLSSQSSAAVIERDWQTPGDGLLTYDTVNKREWLDVPVSLLSQYDPPFVVDAVEIAYQSALVDLESGGQFEGFTVARRDDVFALAVSAGIDTATMAFNINQIATTALIDLLGATYEPSPNFRFTIGLTDELCTLRDTACIRVGRRFGGIFGVSFGSGNPLFAGLDISSDNDDLIGPIWTGMMLYRTTVPEPGTVPLFVFGLIGAELPLIKRRQMWRSRNKVK